MPAKKYGFSPQLVIFLAVVVGSVVLALKYFLMSKYVTKTYQANQSPIWKTYTNTNLGFSLNYPPDVVTDFVSFTADAGGQNILGIKGPGYIEGSDFISGMSIYAKGAAGADIQSAAIVDQKPIKDNWSHQSPNIMCKISQTAINNITAVSQDCQIPENILYVKNQNNGKIIRLTTVSAPASYYQGEIDQILATFKFSN